MIFPLSRYTATSEDRNGKTNVIALYSRGIVPNYHTYTVSDGETFQSIATRFLGSPLLYWRIADINPQIAFPDSIPVGAVIRIPQ